MAKKKAKGGGGKKEKGPNTRTIEKKKKQAVEDATFGMKNKNKSKKVQKQIQGMKQQVEHNVKKKKGPDPKEERRKMKERQKEKEAFEKMIFNPADDPKKKKENEQEQNQQQDDESEQKREENMTIEEKIDYRRSKVEAKTPVTKERFFKWLEKRKAQKETAQKKAKKKTKKTLTGLALLVKDSSLFVDDDDAVDADAYEIKEETLDDVDEDLFDDDDDEEQREYDPDTWTESKTPKELLTDWCINNNHSQPKFKPIPVKGGHLAKVIVPHLNSKEFVPLGIFKSKKLAEHNAALLAYDHIQKEENEEE
eukprot:gb/GECH01009944.1/.p1 GENE.gb/GECH01009944.1/~~gb/GECH01009944.1/.p1  ORF type:complete len:309 (+),score=125.03 gb/GECH01009944.1/:1-927(+)